MSVFDRVARFFRASAPLATDRSDEFPYDQDLWVATVVLLLELAYGDAEYSPEERRTIQRSVEREFGIRRSDALLLMDSAERSRPGTRDMSWIGDQIRERYSIEQRQRVIALLWKVAEADHIIEDFERVFTENIVALLGLTPEQGAQAMAGNWLAGGLRPAQRRKG